MKEKEGIWTKPQLAPFAEDCIQYEPFISPDGKMLFFNSERSHPITGTKMENDEKIWYSEKTESGWGKVFFLEGIINTGWIIHPWHLPCSPVQQSIIIAVNRGCNTDCAAPGAGALCGALSGTAIIPIGWIETLEAGIAGNPYSNAHFTNKEAADGLYRALQNKVYRIEKEASAMTKNLVEAKSLKAYVRLLRASGVIE